MSLSMPGIHHVTAITADAQANIDFYSGTLGLRLVKLTVNFDDPGSYHLYYGDETGRPGSIMTFFAWPGARRGRAGSSQATATSFVVPEAGLAYWADRLLERGLAPRPVEIRFGASVLGFADPDGMALEIVATPELGGRVASDGPIPPEYAIRGFQGVTLAEQEPEASAEFLTAVMGFHAVAREGNRVRLRAEGGGFASVVDLLGQPEAPSGIIGAGVVHHVAFRTSDDDQQRAWRDRIANLGRTVSPIKDRTYFHSIYFREPGGVLFEIATDLPGFAADEPADRLGSRLMLPPSFEPNRPELERTLPPLRLPTWGGVPA